MTTKAIVFENRQVEIEFYYDPDDGYELYEINGISVEYFTDEFMELVISKLERLRVEQGD